MENLLNKSYFHHYKQIWCNPFKIINSSTNRSIAQICYALALAQQHLVNTSLPQYYPYCYWHKQYFNYSTAQHSYFDWVLDVAFFDVHPAILYQKSNQGYFHHCTECTKPYTKKIFLGIVDRIYCRCRGSQQYHITDYVDDAHGFYYTYWHQYLDYNRLEMFKWKIGLFGWGSRLRSARWKSQRISIET